MKAPQSIPRLFIEEELGQDLIECALVAAPVGLGAVTAMKGLTKTIGNALTAVSNSLANAISARHPAPVD